MTRMAFANWIDGLPESLFLHEDSSVSCHSITACVVIG